MISCLTFCAEASLVRLVLTKAFPLARQGNILALLLIKALSSEGLLMCVSPQEVV